MDKSFRTIGSNTTWTNRIKRQNGQVLILKPETAKRSALDIAGIDLGISTEEIVEFVREGRDR